MDRFGHDDQSDDQDDTISMGPPVPPVPPPPGGGRRWRSPRALSFAGVAVIALAGGTGIGYAATHSAPAAANAAVAAATPTPSPTPSNGAGAHGHARHGWIGFAGPFGFGLGPAGIGKGGMLHGQFTVQKQGGGYETLDVQNGTVSAVSDSSLTVKSADGFTATYTVTGSTLVNAQSKGIGSVNKGDTVVVTATAGGSTPTAANVTDVTAIKAGRASLGFPAPGKPHMPTPATPPASS